MPVRPLRVLLSAYACEPDKGSEPGVGWNIAWEMARYDQIWVLTRANNRPEIEAAVRRLHHPRLRFIYHDLPAAVRWWKRGARGVQTYYYLWQATAHRVARRLHNEVDFDLIHHLTFAKYWAPSFLALLPVPFIWGPVGGGESAPRAFRTSLSFAGRRDETLRDMARWVGEHDPFVRATARRSRVALARTEETAERLRRLGAGDVRVFSELGLRREEVNPAPTRPAIDGGLRFVSIGQLRHLKGFHLGIRAFALAGLPTAEYWIVGDGPERGRLEASAAALGVSDRVRFFGWLKREETLRRLKECDVLLHPSLHDSGGLVCLEAMGAGRPVVCLDVGGPAEHVDPAAGIRVSARGPDQTVCELAAALRTLACSPSLRQAMSEAASRYSKSLLWERKGQLLKCIYDDTVQDCTRR